METPYHLLKIHRNVSYIEPYEKNKIESNMMYVDIYQPYIATAYNHLPVILYVHGGSWMWGSCQQANAQAVCKLLACYGFITVSVSYRLCRFSRETVGKAVAVILVFVLFFLMIEQNPIAKKIWWCIVILIILYAIYSQICWENYRLFTLHRLKTWLGHYDIYKNVVINNFIWIL